MYLTGPKVGRIASKQYDAAYLKKSFTRELAWEGVIQRQLSQRSTRVKKQWSEYGFKRSDGAPQRLCPFSTRSESLVEYNNIIYLDLSQLWQHHVKLCLSNAQL